MLTDCLPFSREIGTPLDYHWYVLSREAITIFGRASRQKNGKESGPLVSLFLYLPLLAIFAVLQLPFLPIAALWERSKRKRLVQQMTKQNRVMVWPDFVRALKDKRGTWIIGGLPPNPDWWWTEEDVRAVSPYACPNDLDDLAWTDKSFTPFRLWCYERYTNQAHGRALLVVGRNGARLDFLENDSPEVNSIVAIPPSRRMRKEQRRNLSG
jgi:hypothetical protein